MPNILTEIQNTLTTNTQFYYGILNANTKVAPTSSSTKRCPQNGPSVTLNTMLAFDRKFKWRLHFSNERGESQNGHFVKVDKLNFCGK